MRWPSPFAGKILSIAIKEGETVKVGMVLASIEASGAAAPAPTPAAPPQAAAAPLPVAPPPPQVGQAAAPAPVTPTDGVGGAPSVYLPTWKDGLAIHARYNQAIVECAKARPNVHVVPLHQTFMGHGSHCRQFWRSTYQSDDPYYWFYENIEDPNDRGYDAIRRVFLRAISENTVLRKYMALTLLAERRKPSGECRETGGFAPCRYKNTICERRIMVCFFLPIA